MNAVDLGALADMAFDRYAEECVKVFHAVQAWHRRGDLPAYILEQLASAQAARERWQAIPAHGQSAHACADAELDKGVA